jgi:hypothetical protein
MLDGSRSGNSPASKQSEAWGGEFGSQYSERNRFDAPEFDKAYHDKYGMTRTVLNHEFLKDIPRSSSILEVGCNLGNQLILLHQMGFTNLHGIEINKEIVKSDLELVIEKRLSYLDNGNMDSMFLLHKGKSNH